MKKIVLMMALIFSASAFAQDNNLSTRAPRPASPSPIGIYVGLDYMNITDVHMDSKSRNANGSYTSYHEEGGAHLGLAGITAGYDHTPQQGIGFKAGVRLLEAFNRSEHGDEKLQMVIPEANLTIAANSLLTAYAGANVAVWTGSEFTKNVKPQLGGQAGLGLRFTKNLALSAGYTVTNEKYSSNTFGDDYQADYQYSGFNSNIIYIF